ncbi:MAG: transposase [Luteococcus japonicus]
MAPLQPEDSWAEDAHRHGRLHPQQRRHCPDSLARPSAGTFREGVRRLAPRPRHKLARPHRGHLDDATAVLDAFHVVKLATQAVDEVRRRVQQATLGHRGRKGEPLFGIQTILRCSAANLSDKQKHRLQAAIEAHEAHEEVFIAWQAAQRVRAIYHADTPAAGRAAAQQLLDTLPTCPIPQIARLGRTLKQWREAFLAYFDTDGASNGPTEAINGLIELHRRIARGFRNRDNYRLRCLLIAGGLDT